MFVLHAIRSISGDVGYVVCTVSETYPYALVETFATFFLCIKELNEMSSYWASDAGPRTLTPFAYLKLRLECQRLEGTSKQGNLLEQISHIV